MRIRFWGTRGSLPTATEGAVIRDKIKRALLKAAGRQFADEAALDRFIDTDLEFPLRSGYGGNTSSVESHRRRPLHFMRHGLGTALFWSTSAGSTWIGPAASL